MVARVNNSKNQWLFNESWGVDVSVSTPQQLTALVEEAVSVGSLVRLLEFERATANLLEVTLAASSPAIDTSLGELSMPPDSTIVAIIRDGRLQHPDDEVVLHEGDEVLVLVSADDEEEIQRLFVAP